jgi:hypothetical protein
MSYLEQATTSQVKSPVHSVRPVVWRFWFPLYVGGGGGGGEIGDYAAAVARQGPANNRGMMFSARSAKQRWNGVFCAVRVELLHAG